jgi:hypothetical protein
MQLSSKQISMFLYTAEGIGAVFVVLYSVAYLLGLPTTRVLHSDPTFRSVLSVLGVLLIVFVLTALVLSALVKKKD